MLYRLLIPAALQFIILLTASANTDLSTLKPPKHLDNIHVKAINSNKDASEFVIFIKKEVKAHYHDKHTERVLVLEGEGVFYLDGVKHFIKSGDYIRIEERQIHSVQVTSKTPLKVLSIQTPEFLGKDRVFVDVQ